MAVIKLRAYIILAMCGILMPAANAYTMAQMCQYWSSDGYVGNPNDCQGWGYCKNQKLYTSGTCGAGLVYNPHTAACDYNTEFVCTTSAVQTCNAIKSPAFVADPNNCTQYAYCDGAGGLKYQSCPQNQVFAANNKTCVYGPACPQDGICRFMRNDIFVGDPVNCGKFYQCLNGYSRPGSCSIGYYNYVTGSCQEYIPDICSGSPGEGTGGNTGVTPTSPNAVICKGYTNTDDEDQFFADGSTCYGYYICNSIDGPGIWGKCPFGTHFNGIKCVSPASFACTYNRCGNLDITYVAVEGKNCNEYENCSTGLIGTCPSGHPFYNEVTGFCVETKPAMDICGTAT